MTANTGFDSNHNHSVPDGKDMVCVDGIGAVGHLENKRGLRVFIWSQTPLRFASKFSQNKNAYGMSKSVYNELCSKNVTMVYVSHEDYMFSLSDYSDVISACDPRFNNGRNSPNESQYLYVTGEEDGERLCQIYSQEN